MLEVGSERAEKRGFADSLDFVEANAEELPFENESFDAYTIAFGIRNVPHIETALAEAFRVLKTGGRFLCLEFSEVEMPLLDRVYEQWSFKAIPQIGKAVTGEAEPYSYLVESIRKFPNQQNFAAMIGRAGFERVTFRNYSGGIAALHSGWKL
jgi:demethylmenaquinone methyltransferase/2-methoxy-6-polyprenyl-1,4-benzoquinol methylase